MCPMNCVPMRKKRSTYERRYEIPQRRILIRFDNDEDMAYIRAKAQRDSTSVAEAIRTLITFGIESERLPPGMGGG